MRVLLVVGDDPDDQNLLQWAPFYNTGPATFVCAWLGIWIPRSHAFDQASYFANSILRPLWLNLEEATNTRWPDTFTSGAPSKLTERARMGAFARLAESAQMEAIGH